ncbi:MAG: ABC transporter substrate-binding protein [Bacillota bacterium]|nr:ABC transporter substrate-binding protein [Bacillota bacterium]
MKAKSKASRWLAALLTGVLMLGLLAACQSTPAATTAPTTKAAATEADKTDAPASDDEPIVIGGLAPLTGGVSVYGIASDNGTQLAIDEINAAGGINGRQIKYVVLDEQGDEEQAVTAYDRLVNEYNIVALIGDVTSKPSIAVAQRAARDGLPMIAPTATAADVTLQGKNVFRVCFLDPDQGRTMADFAKNNLNVTKAAVIHNASDDYSVGLAEAFIAQAKELGIEIVSEQTYVQDDKDFRTQLTTIAAAGPDILYAPDYYGTDILILNQAKDAGLNVPLLGGDGWDGILTQTAEDNPKEADGNYFTNHYATSDESPIVQDFLKAFEAKYNEVPISFSALGYDAAHILAAAIERAGSTDKDAIVAALNQTDYEGVTGHITFDENGDPLKPISIIEVVDGAYKLITKIDIER